MTSEDGLIVRDAAPGDRPAIDAFLHGHDTDVVARRGELVDARAHPRLVVFAGDEVAGVLTYVPGEGEVEALTVHAGEPGHGVGTALVAALRARAAAEGWHRIWLITTNDNVDALRFYQRRGFRLVAVDAGAVDAARAGVKPSIPVVGAYGIPIHDELELELLVDPGDATP